ncbi:hypothetical protein GRF59_14850 [Paenibacillus sp. HJL G12]|uniref:Accessory regulator AgrB n=1 Tax=Paenibacillus dendrobii TaxID=2691084 RepID=A0A7X3IJ24_9BACL|nr:accessory gene regulator B family protein [Paenibacillus dendrobii]MWV44898.1 hypothetical protein [Paenibacillus dendrobii]
MINDISDKLSVYLKKRYPNELPSVSIVRYSIKFLISNITPILVLIVSSMLLRIFPEVMIALLGFSILRMFSGGYHIKSAEVCIVVSVVLVYTIVMVSPLIQNIKTIIDIASLVLVVIFAPSNIKKQTRIKEENFIYLKIVSLMIIAGNFIVHSNILTLAFFLQSLSLIRIVYSEKEVMRNAKDE